MSSTLVDNKQAVSKARAYSGLLVPALAAIMLLILVPERAEGNFGKKLGQGLSDAASSTAQNALNSAQRNMQFTMLLSQGTMMTRLGNYDGAINYFTSTLDSLPLLERNWIETDPKNSNNHRSTIIDWTSKTLNYRGDAYLGKKDYARAIADYEAALRHNPTHFAAKYSLTRLQTLIEIDAGRIQVRTADGTLNDPRDGQNYSTVTIGNLTWMAQNLNFTTNESWCLREGKNVTAASSANCAKFGRLYSWEAAQSACPAGWRLPEARDWDNLISAVGREYPGMRLKSKTDWNGTDELGFSALPGGSRMGGSGTASNLLRGADRVMGSGAGSVDPTDAQAATDNACWWTATKSDAKKDKKDRSSQYRCIPASSGIISSGNSNRTAGYSVRCIQPASAPVASAPPPPPPPVQHTEYQPEPETEPVQYADQSPPPPPPPPTAPVASAPAPAPAPAIQQGKLKLGVYVNVTAPPPAGGGMGARLAAAALVEVMKKVSKSLAGELAKLIDRSARLSATDITDAVQAQAKSGTASNAQIVASGNQQGLPLVCVVEVNGPNIGVRLLDVRTSAELVKLNSGSAPTDLKNPTAVAQLIKSVLDLSKAMVTKAEEVAQSAPGTPQQAAAPPSSPASGAPPPPPPPPPPAMKYMLALNRAPEAGGIVTPTSQSEIPAGTQINIIAAPAEGYAFANWTITPEGASLIADRRAAATTVTMSANTIVTANFRPLCTLKVNRYPEIGGAISSAPATVPAETPVSIAATAAAGYDFVNWTAENGQASFANANDASTTVSLSSHATIRANFKRRLHSLAANVNPAGAGAVTPASIQDSIPSGTLVDITTTAAEGYKFVKWTSKPEQSKIADTNSTATTVSMNANTIVTANFRTVYTLTVNRNPADGGSVTPAAPLKEIAPGTSVKISATPDSGYLFANWTVVSGQAKLANEFHANTTVTVNSNAVIAANFYNGPLHTLAVNRQPENGGTVSARQQQGIIPEIIPVGITTSAAEGYKFINWTVTGGRATLNNANDTSTTAILGSNATITANFQPIFKLTTNRNPIAGGTVTATAYSGIPAETPVEIAVSPANGYRFVNWTVTGGQAWFANTNATKTTVILGTDATIAANFQQTHSLALNPNPPASGIVTSAQNSNIAPETPVEIKASPVSGYRFVNWTVTGGQAWFANSNDRNTTVSLDSDAKITANFQKTGDQKVSTVLATFGVGWQFSDYESVSDEHLRDPDRTVVSGTALGTNFLLIRKSGFALSTGVDFIINADDGMINIDPAIGIGYVSHKTHYAGGILNLIAKPYILYDYADNSNYRPGGVFIAPTFIAGYELFGNVSLGGQFSAMFNPASSTLGFRFLVGAGVNTVRK